MANGAKVEGVAPPSIPAGIRKTIQSIKEIVGNHSDADVYAALKEANMDPNETTHKLLHQDPYHEVKRKRSKNKEEKVAEIGSFDQNNQKGGKNKTGEKGQRGGFIQRGGGVHRGGDLKRGDDCQRDENLRQVDVNHNIDGRQNSEEGQRDSGSQKHEVKQRDGNFQKGDFHFQRGSDFRRGGGFYRGSGINRARYALSHIPLKTRAFRVVRDNRVNQTTSQDPSSMHECSISNGEEVVSDLSTKRISKESSINQKSAEVKGSFSQKLNEYKGYDEKKPPVHSINTHTQAGKPKNSRPRFAGQASNNSVLGVYPSSSDPVHVPSPSRSSANGSFRREVCVVGVRKMPTDNAGKQTSVDATLAKRISSAEAIRPRISLKGIQNGLNTATEPVLPLVKVSRPFSSNNQYAHRSYPHPAGHQKAVQMIKEWKPKSIKKNAANAAVESALHAAELVSDGPMDSNTEEGKFYDKHRFEDIQGVIIPNHIRVPDIERFRVSFGSFGLDTNLAGSIAGSQTVEVTVEVGQDHSPSLSAPASDASNVNKVAAHESTESSAFGAVGDRQFSDSKVSSCPQTIENYSEVGLVRSDSSSYTPELQKQHEAADAGSFSAYDPQTGYAVTHFRHSVDEASNDRLLSVHEGFNPHAAGMIPASHALYQQHAQVGQMYPQVHVSHYMPYRQLIPPVYAPPPMGMPGYSANGAYAHPVNGNGYMLMPGGTSHLNVSAMKFGVQPQFKPSPGGSPTGYGNYTTPDGYTVNAPGGMMGTSGVEDPSRVKYKDGNLYAQNPQAEAQELWNSREMPSLQHPQFYNMQGQGPHGTYMGSHPGHHHATFNPAAGQSSHMQQYQNLFYHPQANVGVVPQAPPVGSYQQPQMNSSNLQWTSNNTL